MSTTTDCIYILNEIQTIINPPSSLIAAKKYISNGSSGIHWRVCVYQVFRWVRVTDWNAFHGRRLDNHLATLLPKLLIQTISFQHSSRQTSQSDTYTHTAQTQIIPPQPLFSRALLPLRRQRNAPLSELPGKMDLTVLPLRLPPFLVSYLQMSRLPAALPSLFSRSILRAELLRSIPLVHL